MIFSVHPVKDDLSSALQYGPLTYINERYVYGDEIDQQNIPSAVAQKLEQAAAAFDPQTDFLLIVGDHLQLIQFSAMLASYQSWFRVLRYDRQAQGYLPIKVLGGGK